MKVEMKSNQDGSHQIFELQTLKDMCHNGDDIEQSLRRDGMCEIIIMCRIFTLTVVKETKNKKKP